jgi:hypothetical protein
MTALNNIDDLGADTFLGEHNAHAMGIVVGGVGVTGQPIGHAHGGPPRLLKFRKQKKRTRPEGASGNIHNERVFVAGDKIAHLLEVNSAIFRPPLYPLCVHYPNEALQSAFRLQQDR